MLKYSKLPIPKNSSWGRMSWRRFVHWRIKYIIDGVYNIIRWIPILFNDRDWDDFYITKLLQKKIENQRKYLVKHNRHLNVDSDNFWMTIVLNLIELEHEEFYSTECMEYYEIEDLSSNKLIFDNLEEYINKYPSAKRIVLKEYPELISKDNLTLAFYIANYRQKKCRNLIFEILKRKSIYWWD